MEEIINKVALSGLVTVDLEEFCDAGVERRELAMKDFLFQGLIVREKEYRQQIKETDWTDYRDSYVYITTPSEAIIPTWAFMLLTVSLSGIAKEVHVGSREELDFKVFKSRLDKEDLEVYRGKKVVIKGCGSFPVPSSCYVEITGKLALIADSLMYGEPCSTVPVFKRKKI